MNLVPVASIRDQRFELHIFWIIPYLEIINIKDTGIIFYFSISKEFTKVSLRNLQKYHRLHTHTHNISAHEKECSQPIFHWICSVGTQCRTTTNRKNNGPIRSLYLGFQKSSACSLSIRKYKKNQQLKCQQTHSLQDLLYCQWLQSICCQSSTNFYQQDYAQGHGWKINSSY